MCGGSWTRGDELSDVKLILTKKYERRDRDYTVSVYYSLQLTKVL